jgi:hypothetical protein
MFNLGMCILRPNSSKLMRGASPFIMLEHKRGKKNRKRFSMLSRAVIDQFNDGLNSVDKGAEIVNVQLHKSFTWISVKLKF